MAIIRPKPPSTYSAPYVEGDAPWVRAANYSTVQDAVDAVHSNFVDSDKTIRQGVVEISGEIEEQLILRSGVHLKGVGVGSTILRMPAGGTGDVVKSEDYDSLVGTDGGLAWVGEHHTRISDLTVDGNAANAPLGRNGISLYGFNQNINRVAVRQCIQDGIHTDAPVAFGIEAEDDQDGFINRFDTVDVNNNGRDGIRWSGPNDSQMHNVIPWKNASAQIRVTEKGGSLVISKAHPYAGSSPTTAVGDYGLWADVPVLCSQCQFESQEVACVYLTGEASTYAFQGASASWLQDCRMFLAITGAAGLILDGSVSPLYDVWVTEARFSQNKTAIKPIGSGHAYCKITGWSYSASGETMLDTSSGDLPLANDNHLELMSVGPGTPAPRYQIPAGYGAATFEAGIDQLHVSGTHAARLAITAPPVGQLWKETDTGVTYVGTGSAWTVWNPRGAVLKTADEIVNNSTTLQNDNHLLFPIGTNEQWLVKVWAKIAGVSVNADAKFGWGLPTSATIEWQYSVNMLGSAAAVTPGTLFSQAITPAVGLTNGTCVIQVWGWVASGATAGNVQLMWAQNTLTAEDVTLKVGSLLELTRLA